MLTGSQPGSRRPGEEVVRYRCWLEGLIGIPATDGNRIEILRNGDQILPAMLDAIGQATTSVDLATFVLKGAIAEEFCRVLAERCRAGVRVRVLADAFGSLGMDKQVVGRLRAAGALVDFFRPLNNLRVWETFHRGHRKILVCDGEVGFTGGVGIGDVWRGDARDPSEWRDTHFRVEGPAVDGLMGAFVHNWAETRRPLLDQGDRFPERGAPGASTVQVVRGGARTGWGDMSTLVHVLAGLARRRLRICAAYFVPDHAILALLCETARRGVAVELLVNGPHADKRVSRLASEAQFELLLQAGVRVWTFQPTMLHAKIILVDGTVASTGSANLNARSLVLDEELNLVVCDPDVVRVLESHFDEDLERAQEVALDEWSGRGLTQKGKEALPGFMARHL
ncbi:MAG: phospholipase D-like domain-containing protein [Actinomycetota bacterium]|nr:phospholipase D-like domain-containing protein [Actinomycetota bacterium]